MTAPVKAEATWMAPTKRDLPEFARNELSQCDYCPRVTNADILVQYPAGQSRFMCDACRELLFRQGTLTREEFYRDVGAPAEALARIRACADALDGAARQARLAGLATKQQPRTTTPDPLT